MKRIFLMCSLLPIVSFSQKDSTSAYFLYTGLNYEGKNFLGNYKSNVSPILGFYRIDNRKNRDDFQLYNIAYREEEFYVGGLDSASATIFYAQKTNTASWSASYHKIIGLNKNKDSKFFIGLGLGGLIHYNYQSITPGVSNAFPTRDNAIDFIISLKPTLTYNITKRMFVGASANVFLVDFILHRSKTENPSIPLNQQQVISFGTEFFPGYGVNFQGMIGINLN